MVVGESTLVLQKFITIRTGAFLLCSVGRFCNDNQHPREEAQDGRVL